MERLKPFCTNERKIRNRYTKLQVITGLNDGPIIFCICGMPFPDHRQNPGAYVLTCVSSRCEPFLPDCAVYDVLRLGDRLGAGQGSGRCLWWGLVV
jgi:hypothetical protein